MKPKTIITVVLLGFVGVSVTYLIIQESTSEPVVRSASGQMETARSELATSVDEERALVEPDEQPGHQLVAYYFHRTQRCQTCLTIEAYAEEALAEAFPQALRSGELEWRAVNVEEPANEHIVEDYQLTASALVLVDTQDGEQEEWRDLERVWELVGDELEFKAYVEAEALAFLEEGL